MAAIYASRTVNALKLLVNSSMTPYAAARKAQINLSTMYKNPLYKRWRDGDIDGVKKELAKLDGSEPIPRLSMRKNRVKNAQK